MDNLLLEIGAEEIPAGYIRPALKALSSSLLQKLTEARIEHGNAKVYGTPRRLAVNVENVAHKQQSIKKKTEQYYLVRLATKAKSDSTLRN